MSDGRASNGTNSWPGVPRLYGYRAVVEYTPGLKKDAPKRNVIVFIIYVQVILGTLSLVHLLT